MTDPIPLSPTAQAVLDATDYPEDWATRIRVAAALRAAIVATQRQRICPTMGWAVDGQDYCLVSDLDTIATELDPTTTETK